MMGITVGKSDLAFAVKPEAGGDEGFVTLITPVATSTQETVL